MNWDRLEGQWKQQRGKAFNQWGKTMNDELSSIFGRYQELVGKLQEKYGIAKDEARHRMVEHKIIVEQLKQANSKLAKLHKELSKKEKSEKHSVKTKAASKGRK